MPGLSRQCRNRFSETSGFIHDRMIKSRGVGVESLGLQGELAACLSPCRNRRKNFAQNGFGGVGFEAEAWRSGHRSGDGGLFLLVGNRRS